jgi:hypothetical protein
VELQKETENVGILTQTVYAAPLHEYVREVACSLALLYATVHGRANPQICEYRDIFESRFNFKHCVT